MQRRKQLLSRTEVHIERHAIDGKRLKPKGRPARSGSHAIKTQRPFVPRRPMHVVLRSSRARGELSLLRPDHERKVAGILRAQAKKHFVQLQEFVNVGNHIHIKVKANTRETFQAFLISVTALIARKVTGARRGHAFGKFWDALAFTRIVATKFEEQILDRYFTANIYERETRRVLRSEMGKEVRDIFLGKVKLVPS